MRALLLDLDGTLYTDVGPVPGGPELVARLRSRGTPFRCLTNTTTRSREDLVQRVTGYGYDIRPEEIITPARAAVQYCQANGIAQVFALSPQASLTDLTELTLAWPGEGADAVIIGDLGERWTYGLLQQAFHCLESGARLIALSRDRFYQKGGELTLDAGPFVAALEYAAGVTATVVGKPSAEFYRLAVESMGVAPSPEVVMVGDDIWSDVDGAQRAGLTGWLVKTGKYRDGVIEKSGVEPGRVIESVGEVG
jgi:HAD superfamily hydrolase (TIGR01458 family)